jgi:DNA polymerase-3 subunit epsilon
VLAVALWLGGLAGFPSTLSATSERAGGDAGAARRAGAAMGWLLGLSGWVAGTLRAAPRWVGSAARLAEQAGGWWPRHHAPQLRLPGQRRDAGAGRRDQPAGGPARRPARRRGRPGAQASRSVEQGAQPAGRADGRADQSVVVCNLDGRILLYNSRARLQFRAAVRRPRWPAAPS